MRSRRRLHLSPGTSSRCRALARAAGFTLAVLLLLGTHQAAAQAPLTSRASAATVQALTTYPGFYHLKSVIVRGELDLKQDEARLVPAGGVERGVRLILRNEHPVTGRVEVRGMFWDVGRLSPGDPHVAPFDLEGYVQKRMGDRWPSRGELLAVFVTGISAVPTESTDANLRQVAVAPERYEGQTVTVRGQFGGRNLLGDLPQAPRVSRFDFVLRSTTAAVWVTGVQPKGKGWSLDPESRMDTAQWLEVEGIVRQGNGLVWLEAKRIEQTTAVEEPAEPKADLPPPPPAPAPEVLFSLPAQDDTDIAPNATVQFQVSRDLDPETLEGHIKASYVGDAAATPLVLKATFDRGARVLQVTFEKPLERFRTVRVELTDSIKGTDGQPLKPFVVSFSVGG